MLTDKELLNYVTTEGIQWYYTTALAPWQEGFYETLVGITIKNGSWEDTLEQLIIWPAIFSVLNMGI